MKWLCLFAALIAQLSNTWAVEPAALSISDGRTFIASGDALRAQPLNLNGHWHFVADRWIAPAELASATAQADLALVPGGRPGEAYGIGSYWLQIDIGKNIPQPSALRFQYICGAAAVYFYRDGDSDISPLLSAGKLGRNTASEKISGNNLLVNLPPLQRGTYTLLVHQSNFHLREGGLCGTVNWGLQSSQSQLQIIDLIKNTVIATMLLSLALGSLMLGSQNGERAAPWLALMCTSCAALIAFNSGLIGNLMPADSPWRGNLDYIGIFTALIWLPPALLMVFRHTFAIALARWLVLANLILPAVLTLGVVSSVSFFATHPQFITAAWCTQTIIALGVLASACQRGRQYAWIAMAASVILGLATLYDLYRFFTQGVIEILSPYAGAFLAAVHGGIYTLKFGASYQLAARLSAHLQEEVDIRTRELREKNHNLEQTQNALQRANENLRELSVTDGLTRVNNRMYFEQQFEKEWRRCARHALPLSILMIDADHFKQLNDSAGHLVGDLCLQAIAQTILNNFKRSGEVVARYGGEEFIVLLPDANQSKALAAAEGLRTAIERLSVTDSEGRSYRVTISIGVSSTIPSIDQRAEQLIATADAALYEAKDAGRNRVHSIPIIASRTAMTQQKLHL
ncbi:MAG: diguanylate cyclase [Spongiibacteraceae bacterium]